MSRTRRAVRLPRTGTVPTVVGIAVLAMGVALFGISPSFNPLDVFRGFTTEVPDVVGESQPRALLDLDRANLEGEVRFDYDPDVPRGLVAGQDPAAGDLAPRGSTVVVVVSRGPALVPVPDVIGMTEEEATAALDDVGLDAVIETEPNELVPAGLVLSQDPPPGRILLGGAEVEVVVSTGPAIRTVPEVIGVPIEGAAFRLGQAGLELGELRLADDPGVPIGAVVSADPAPGARVERDTPVAMVISSGAPAVPVPDLVGTDEADAAELLGALGLLVGQIVEPAEGRADQVLAQDPSPGTPLKPGSVVTLTVADDAPGPETSSTVEERGGGGG